MPTTPTYPGVYVEEIPSGVRTITGVATSITAFIGSAERGPTNDAVTINSFGDFERQFGGLSIGNALGFAVRDFFLNGGSRAVIVRLFHENVAPGVRKAALDAARAVETGANKAATAAVAGSAGKDAKTAASAAATEVENKLKDDRDIASAVKDIIKGAAKDVAKALSRLDDSATVEDVAKEAQTAVDAVSAEVASSKASLSIGSLTFEAASEGKWGVNLRARIDTDNLSKEVATGMGVTLDDLFNLTVSDASVGGKTEKFLNLTVKESPRRVDKVLGAGSSLLRYAGSPDPDALQPYLNAKKAIKDKLDRDPAADVSEETEHFKALSVDPLSQKELAYADAAKALTNNQNAGASPGELETAKDRKEAAKEELDKDLENAAAGVAAGLQLAIGDFLPQNAQIDKKGLYALENVDLFNLLCIPPYKATEPGSFTFEKFNVEVNLVSECAAYCEKRRAMLIVDSPSGWTDKDKARKGFSDSNEERVGARSRNAALYFPRLVQPNPLRENQPEVFGACGAVAGIMARTDTQRGVWKAPAGLDAALVGVPSLSVPLTDAENGELNPLGINCLRAFPASGRVVWGARTLRGNDQLADEYKYIPVRRTALYIEESLYRGLKWVVFEPNDEPLWSQIRLNVGAFMQNLFRQGAFQGTTPKDAYFVKCDKETNPQNDIDRGIVNVIVGFAPLKPAEFVIIKLQQMAGQIET